MSVTFNQEVCDDIGVSSQLFAPAVTDRGCNDMCSSPCVNFLELLARSLMEHNVINSIRGINNDGNALCDVASSDEGIDNKIILGWWKNTEEENVCHTDILFNRIITDSSEAGFDHLILLGQSHAGKKFTYMISNTNWAWGNGLKLDLFTLWDGASLEGPVTAVGSRPKFVLNFFESCGLCWPFQSGTAYEWWQQGSHITDADEEHDLSFCFSHNALARSVFVHTRTEEVMTEIITDIRDEARPGQD
jgi:hypothetical protein